MFHDVHSRRRKQLRIDLLFTNGVFKVACRPLLHAGELTVVQSPASIWAVGMKAIAVVGRDRSVVAWCAPKKNSLFLTIDPPTSRRTDFA